MSKNILFTMDIDWASEDVIILALALFKKLNVPCLLFQTHKSQAILNEKSPLFSLELHPNFLENSDHGNTIEKIIEAVDYLPHLGCAIRAHKYFLPIDALKIYATKGYRFSLNNYTNLTYQSSFLVLGKVLELNTFFEDGFYLKYQNPLIVQYILDRMVDEGTYVFNVHPIHLAFNAKEYLLTRTLKDTMSRSEYRSIDQKFILDAKSSEYGITDFLTDLVLEMKRLDFNFLSIDEVNHD